MVGEAGLRNGQLLAANTKTWEGIMDICATLRIIAKQLRGWLADVVYAAEYERGIPDYCASVGWHRCPAG